MGGPTVGYSLNVCEDGIGYTESYSGDNGGCSGAYDLKTEDDSAVCGAPSNCEHASMEMFVDEDGECSDDSSLEATLQAIVIDVCVSSIMYTCSADDALIITA